MARIRIARLVLIVVLVSLTAHVVVAQDTLTAQFLVEMRSVTDAVISPTGDHVAYVMSVPRSADDDPGGAYSELWVMNVDGSNARCFTPPGTTVSDPQWSPDGAQIAFLTQREPRDEHDQIYLIAVDGGEAMALTDHPTAPGSIRWAFGGPRIAFIAQDEQSETQQADEEAGRDWTVVDADVKHSRLWTVHTLFGTTQRVYEDDLDDLSVSAFTWLPDGSFILQAASTSQVDDTMMYSRLFALSELGGSPQVVCETSGKLGDMAVSPDGNNLAFLGAVSLNDPLAQSEFIVPIDGSEPRNLMDGAERSTAMVSWLDDDSTLVVSDQGTLTSIHRVDVETGEWTELYRGGPIVGSIDLHPESGQFVVVAAGPTHGPELFVGSINGGGLQRRTFSNPELADLPLGRVERFEWVSTDGWSIQGVVTFPPDYQAFRRYPTIVNPHGGPEGVTQQGWSNLPQLLATNGYVVFQPNYRGSGGRGVNFAKGDHDDLGGQEFADILSGIEVLIDQRITDPERIGIGGWSYGGYLSALAATHHSDRFKAAVMGAGISNWVSFTGTTDIPHEMSLVHWNRWWYDNQALYWRRSPLSAIAAAHTPTLILHGENDDRVHPGQALEMYQALKTKGVDTELVMYPRASHGISERAHRIDILERQLAWFDKYVKGS